MKTTGILFGAVIAFLLTFAMLFTAGWTAPPILSTQWGFRGTGMDQLTTPAVQRALKAANVLPDPIDPASPDGDKATAVYQNVQVLTDLSADQFNRVMLGLGAWVGGEQGCAYCHNTDNMADDVHEEGRAPNATDDAPHQRRLAGARRLNRRHLLYVPSRSTRAALCLAQ